MSQLQTTLAQVTSCNSFILVLSLYFIVEDNAHDRLRNWLRLRLLAENPIADREL